MLDYIKKKRVCSTVPVFSGQGGGEHGKFGARELAARCVNKTKFPTHPHEISGTTEQTPLFSLLLTNIYKLSIYLSNKFNHLHYPTPTPAIQIP